MRRNEGVAIITDSTACLPDHVVEGTGGGTSVVPLNVLLDGESFVEDDEMGVADVVDALERGVEVSTSRPSPARLVEAYQRAADAGASEIVSVHLSAQLSATVGSARLAAAEAPVPVTVLDSRTLGMAMGFGVLAGWQAAVSGTSAADVAAIVQETASLAGTTIYVDTLEPLRRGGRLSRAGSVLGSALSIKPLLAVHEGQLEVAERVRTSSKAIAKLISRTSYQIEDALSAGRTPYVAIHSLSRRDLADHVVDELVNAHGDDLVIGHAPLGAVVTAHVGPGTVAAVVSTNPSETPLSSWG